MRIKEIIKSVKLPARASVYYLAASILGKIINFILIPFSTRLMSSEEYGQLSLYMALLGGASVICSAFSSSSAVYKGIKDHDENKSEYIKSVLWTSWGFSVIICILLFAFSPLLALKGILYIPLALQIICDTTIAVAMCSGRFYYQYKRVVVITVISVLLPPTLSIIILKTWGGGYLARIFSLLTVSVCLAIYCYVNILKTDSRTSIENVKYIVKNSIPLLPHTASSAFLVQADKLIITSLLGAAALAKYSVVYSLGMALQFTVTSISSALSPWLIRRLEARDEEKIRRLIFPMALGYFALSVCLIAIAPEAMKILAPPEYSDALPSLVPIALSTPFYFLSTVATVGLIQSGKGGFSIIISCINAVLCIGLNYSLIGSLGFLGAGIVNLVCHAVSAMLSIYMLGKFGHKRFISSRWVAMPFLLSGVLGLLIYGFSDSIAPRVARLCLPAIILIYCMMRVVSLVIEKDGKAPS